MIILHTASLPASIWLVSNPKLKTCCGIYIEGHQRLTPESDTLKTCPLGNFLGQVLVEQKTINFGLVKCAPNSGAKAKCSKFPFLQIFSVRLTYLDRRRECVAGNLAHCDHQCTVYFIFCPLCTLFCVHCDHQCTLFCAQWATELKRTLPYRSL